MKLGTGIFMSLAIGFFAKAWTAELGSPAQGYWIAGAACAGTFALMWQIIRKRS